MGAIRAGVGRISTPGNRFTASRRLHTGDPRAIASHNRRVGEVIHAFNTAQAALFTIFISVAAGSDWRLARDLWHSQPSDLAQRKLLASFVRHSAKSKTIIRSILWSIAAMDELSRRRNDCVHADVIWYYDQLAPGIGTDPKRAKRLEELPFSLIWKELRGDLAAVANYASDLYLSLGEARPLTKRPTLKLARTTDAAQQARRNRAKKAARDRQRVSSRQSAPAEPK